jgi:AraC-like DNA-binding protein
MKDYVSGIISILASFQLLFVSVFLIAHKKGNRTNNRLLGLVFLLFSLSLGDFALRISGIEFRHQLIHLIDDGFFFLYGPLLYFYVRRVVYIDLRWRVKDLLHLIPYMIYCIFLVYTQVVLDQVEQQEFTQKIVTASLPAWFYLVGISIYIYIIAYLWLAYRTVNTYRSIIKNRFSSLEKINLNWLRFIIHSFAAITIIAMIHNVIPVLGNIFFLYSTLIFLLIFTFFFINRVLVKALNQPEIFAGIELQETREKYTGSRFKADEIEQYYTQLLPILEEEKLYLNPDLTLQILAGHLNISSKVISQVINQRSGKNFFDFINSYRCEEAKNLMMTSDAKVTILEILYEAGFNSKSSFNKEFKKLNGNTPSEYRKMVSKS